MTYVRARRTKDGRLVSIARRSRANPTRSEAILWESLRGRRLEGLRFRRQHPIGFYVVDFFCPAAALVIEVDGPVHDGTADKDETRQRALEHLGFRVLRFSADEIERDSEPVLAAIAKVAGRRAPSRNSS